MLEAIYEGQDIRMVYGDYRLVISEGSGCNLDADDDKNGYVDYFNLDLYEKKDTEEEVTIGGGMMMLKELISETLYGKTVKEIIGFVFEQNGDEDYFEIKADKVPDYVLIDEE